MCIRDRSKAALARLRQAEFDESANTWNRADILMSYVNLVPLEQKPAARTYSELHWTSYGTTVGLGKNGVYTSMEVSFERPILLLKTVNLRALLKDKSVVITTLSGKVKWTFEIIRPDGSFTKEPKDGLPLPIESTPKGAWLILRRRYLEEATGGLRISQLEGQLISF